MRRLITGNDLVNLFVFRYVFHVKISIAGIVILMCVFGVEIAFIQNGTFTQIFLFNCSVTRIFRHSGMIMKFLKNKVQ